VSIAPVTDWLDYDTHYTERYLGVPDLKNTAADYDRNGLLVYAKDLSRPLLLVHGTADDNVHFSHTLRLADELFRAGRPFELLPLVGQTHLPHEPALMLRFYQRVFGFFRANL
jgi:dipeptidyl-peptidase-4